MRGREHFARECPTRLKRGQTQNSPGRKYPRGLSSRPRPSGDEPWYAKVQGGNEQAESGKTVRAEDDSSLHLHISGMADEKPAVSVRIKQGTPTVSLEIEEKLKHLIVYAGSNVSLQQTGVSRSDVRGTAVKP